jgi:hypothetical protein
MKPYEDIKVQLQALTLAIDGGEWSASCLSCFTPRTESQVPVIQAAGWAPEPLFTLWRREEYLAPAGN